MLHEELKYVYVVGVVVWECMWMGMYVDINLLDSDCTPHVLHAYTKACV